MERYNSYKDSGVEWIGEIPNHWGTTRIKYTSKDDKYSFIDGDWIESKNLSDDGIRYITTGNIGEGKYKEQGKGYISEETFNELNCTEIFEGDLIISRLSLPVGRSCVLPNIHHKVVTSVDNVILRPKEKYNKHFLNYQFNSPRYFEYTELISRGVTLTRISRGMLGNNPIVIPPLSEQQQIVSFLDTKTSLIDSLIEKTQRKIELLKEKRTSLINEVVTKGLNPNVEMKDSGVEWIGEIPSHWEIKKVKHITKVSVGLVINPSTYFNDKGTVPIITGKNVKVSGIDLTDVDYITVEDNIKLKQSMIYEGDIITMRVGYYLGRTTVVSKREDGINCCSLIITRKSKLMNSYFLNYVFNSFIGDYQIEVERGGMGTPVINIGQWKEFYISYTNPDEQELIVEYLDEQTGLIDNTISIEEKRIELLKEYRQSLISEVVTGKRKVV